MEIQKQKQLMELGFIILVAFVSFFITSITILLTKWYLSAKSISGIPGNIGWPIIGESLSYISEFSSPNGIHSFIKKRQEIYGKVFKSSVLGIFTVFVTGSEASKILLSGKDGLVISSVSYAGRQLLGATSVLHLNGEKHKRIRRLISEPLSQNSLKDSFHFINNLVIETLDKWQGKKDVFVLEEVSTFLLKVISNMTMSLEPDGEEQEKFGSNFKLLSAAFASLPFMIPGTAYYRGMKARERMCAMITSIIEDRRNGKNLRQDFLQSLLKKQKNDEDEKLTDAELIDNILTLLGGGHGTTSAALTWVMKFVEENPHVLERLREEHRGIQENGPTLMWSDINNMPYTNKVIDETLRKATVLPWFTRIAAHDFVIEGHKIKKGWSLNMDAIAIHQDPTIFPQPEKFDPSRFDENLKPFSYLGFGSGPRMCPGMNLAKLEMSIFIHHLVCKYKWTPLEKDDSVHPTLFRMPRNNYPVTVVPL